MGTLYLSEYRLRMGPTLCMLVVVMTDGPCVTGVMGAVGVVGVWGKLCGDASDAVLESVTLDTRFSCGGKDEGLVTNRVSGWLRDAEETLDTGVSLSSEQTLRLQHKVLL